MNIRSFMVGYHNERGDSATHEFDTLADAISMFRRMAQSMTAPSDAVLNDPAQWNEMGYVTDDDYLIGLVAREYSEEFGNATLTISATVSDTMGDTMTVNLAKPAPIRIRDAVRIPVQNLAPGMVIPQGIVSSVEPSNRLVDGHPYGYYAHIQFASDILWTEYGRTVEVIATITDW